MSRRAGPAAPISEVFDDLGLYDSSSRALFGESANQRAYLSPYVDQFMSVHH